MCFCQVVWLLAYGLMYAQESVTAAQRFANIGYTGVIFIPVTYYHFVICYLRKKYLRWWLVPFYLITSGFVVMLWLSPFLVSGVQRYFWGFYPIAGVLHPMFLTLFCALLTTSVWLLFLGFTREGHLLTEEERKRVQLVFVASALNSIACVDFLPNYGIEIYPFGYLFGGVLVAGIVYTIIKHQLLDIRVEVTRTGLLLAIYLVVLGGPFLVGWWGRALLEQVLGQGWWLIPLLLSTALATIGPLVYASLRRRAEEQLLKEQRRYQRTLQYAARGMTQVRNIGRLSSLITRVVSRSVKVSHASLFLWDKISQQYVLQSSHGPNRLALQSRYRLELRHPFIQWMVQSRRSLNREESMSDQNMKVKQELMNLNAVLVIPGFIENRLVGFLALGAKLSGRGYSSDDLHAFSTLANEAAIAIENAISYEELLKANEQLKAASERLLLQERLAAAGQFSAGMAHEIRNPLSAINIFAQYLPVKYDDPEFREKFFRIIQSEIGRINTIVNSLSDFAKPPQPNLQPMYLSDIVEDTIALLSNQCLKQGVEVAKCFGENGVVVQADPQQLKQVLLNLILNSLDAMQKGGRLEVKTWIEGISIILRVADTGYGISPDHLAKIWDPFFTTKERGMGLGLAIVKSIIERHGGQISVLSELGEGTTFTVTLPVSSN